MCEVLHLVATEVFNHLQEMWRSEHVVLFVFELVMLKQGPMTRDSKYTELCCLCSSLLC